MAKHSTKPVVIVTGVSSGIGLAVAKRFAAAGWIVVGTVRSRQTPAALIGVAVDLQRAEMGRSRDLVQLVNQTVKTYGRIDALVANAGYGLIGSVESLTRGAVEQQLSVNVAAVAELIALVMPTFRRQRDGCVVAISSVAGRLGVPGYAAYSASKFALSGLLESFSYEAEDDGVRVKLVEPSAVKTPFWRNLVIPRPIKRGRPGWVKVFGGSGLTAEQVASTVWRATTDRSARLHYGVGQTPILVALRRLLPDRLFRAGIRRFY